MSAEKTRFPVGVVLLQLPRKLLHIPQRGDSFTNTKLCCWPTAAIHKEHHRPSRRTAWMDSFSPQTLRKILKNLSTCDSPSGNGGMYDLFYTCYSTSCDSTALLLALNEQRHRAGRRQANQNGSRAKVRIRSKAMTRFSRPPGKQGMESSSGLWFVQCWEFWG